MKFFFTLLIASLLCLPVAVAADENTPATTDESTTVDADTVVTTQEAAKEMTLAEYLVGVWDITPNKRILSGDITFTAEGAYEKNEEHSDGKVGDKGEYKLYPDQTPCGIDICLGKCGQSEWTTLFGIIRMLDDGRVEILTSPTSTRPTAFGEEPDPTHTMFLTRRTETK
ncbi:MAG TPA: hypothetical protein PLF13_01425 [candidate division Zixibacteria bacterium]|nr:hypothetical protein [candidate division Zixibacteria bacterium]